MPLLTGFPSSLLTRRSLVLFLLPLDSSSLELPSQPLPLQES